MRPDSFKECRQCVFTSPLFEGLSEEELSYLANYASNQSFRKGEIVSTQGKEIQFISFLKKGLLKLFKTSDDGRDQIISIAKPNDCIGLLSVFSNHNYQYSVAALEDSTIYYIELSRVKSIIRNNGPFGLKLLGRISNAADYIISNTYTISLKNLRGRIAFCLLEFSEDIYHKNTFDLPLSRKEIAELIGMTTENVIRILSEFRRDNIIDIQGKTISILKPELLKTIEKNG
jgi:CRP/FNR family transcriptional regulator